MGLPASSINTLIPACASAIDAQPPHAPEPTTIASYCSAIYTFRKHWVVWARESNLLVLRMSACRKLKVDAVAPVIECLNRAGARRVKGKRIFPFDKSVGRVGRMLRSPVAFRSSHLGHQSSAPFPVGRVKARFPQGRYRGTPLLLRIRRVPITRMQNEVNELGAVCLPRAGRFVRRNENFSE